jgi:catechol 2,3-dioxygenase-like lactoylglutathione lyase family enzyme
VSGDQRAAAFSHLAIVVDDIDASRQFYEAVLGFTPADAVFRGSGDQLASIMGVERAAVEGLFMRRGPFVLELLRYVDGAGDAPRGRHPSDAGFAHLSFVVDDITATMDAACEHGGSARRDSLSEVAMGASQPVVMGFVADPGGNAIELIAHAGPEVAAAHASFLGADAIGWPPAAGAT